MARLDSGRGGSNRHHHQSKRDRVHGAYRKRLTGRGLSKAPTMATVESLQKRQAWMLKFIENGEPIPAFNTDLTRVVAAEAA